MEYICDAVSRLLFKFRSGIYTWSEGVDIEAIRGREGKRNVLCVGRSVRM